MGGPPACIGALTTCTPFRYRLYAPAPVSATSTTWFHTPCATGMPDTSCTTTPASHTAPPSDGATDGSNCASGDRTMLFAFAPLPKSM